MDELLDRLAAIVAPAGLRTDADEVAPYAVDWRKRYRGRPRAVVLPASTAEVAAVVRECVARRVAIVPQGGNTGLAGGATPDDSGRQIVLGLRRMNRIRACDRDNQTLTVEAGCTLAEVQQAAAAEQRLFPLSLAAEGTCTIGGNLATNAGGTAVLRYGNMRELTLGLEVVLADGSVWDGLRGLRKDNSGYDLKQLFIGAEGTLGIITAAVLRTFPRPAGSSVAVAALPSPRAAVALLERLRQRYDARLTAFELFSDHCLALVLRQFPGTPPPFAHRPPWYALVEIAHPLTVPPAPDAELAAALDGASDDAVLAASPAQAGELWGLRENISEAQAREGKNIKHDISLPTSAIPEFIAVAGGELERVAPGSRLVCFGHLGDGNLHFNVSAPAGVEVEHFLTRQAEINRVVHDRVVAAGGSISAEHGIGQLRRDDLLRYQSPVAIGLMRTLKAALDPQWILNPGKLLAGPPPG